MSAPAPRTVDDSYCGLYCGACDVRHAGETGHRTRFAAVLNERTLRAALRSRGLPQPPSEALELRCGGCKSDALFATCRGCEIRACAVRRGVARCSECADFPCRTYRDWKKAAALLPHVRDAGGNLESIRTSGVERWLAEQDERWSCPGCRAPIAWYSDACDACGRDVRDRTNRLSPWRAVLLRLVFAIARPRRAAATGRRGS